MIRKALGRPSANCLFLDASSAKRKPRGSTTMPEADLTRPPPADDGRRAIARKSEEHENVYFSLSFFLTSFQVSARNVTAIRVKWRCDDYFFFSTCFIIFSTSLCETMEIIASQYAGLRNERSVFFTRALCRLSSLSAPRDSL